MMHGSALINYGSVSVDVESSEGAPNVGRAAVKCSSNTNEQGGDDALAIDLAGRQRMLNQRFVKEIVARAMGMRTNPDATYQLLQQTMTALVAGGEVVVRPGPNPVSALLPPAPTPEIRARLAEQRNLIETVKKSSEEVLRLTPGRPPFMRALEELWEQSERLHQAANDGVIMLTKHSQAQKEAMRRREQAMSGQMRQILAEVAVQAQTLAAAAEELTATSRQMSTAAQQTSTQLNVASSTSERITTSVHTVVSATEQMNVSVREIARQTSEAAAVAASAIRAAEITNSRVGKLAESSNAIGRVTKVISAIAAQTNLLALNATIEAARAGEAGKGFAIVANEVKELAKATANATEEITQRIEAIQTDTRAAAESIEEITSIIKQIDMISSSIAGAVEEQTTTTTEMVRNLSEASRGTSDVSENVKAVAEAADGTSQGADNTQTAADEVARMAEELKGIVSEFGDG
jgi:methyl-accepting chemotaxis protein